MRYWLGSLFLLVATNAMAAQLTIEPGLWQTTLASKDPFSGKVHREVSKHCVKEPVLKPTELVTKFKDCQAVSEKMVGETLHAVMRCDMQGVSTEISGQFRSFGNRGEGDITMQMRLGGMAMALQSTLQAERVGDCQ